MSDREWYEGLPGDDFFGKHLQVHMTNGVIYTGPVLADDCLVAMNLCGESRSILERESATSEWCKSPSVVSVSLLWDERDWEQIRTEDISKADAIVVNGRLIRVKGLFTPNRFLPIEGSSVPFEHVSYALRHRSKLPTELGTYRGADGALLIRLKAVFEEEKWMYISRDFSDDDAYVGDEVARKYLPLTPVHFVDGRAE